MTPPFTVIIDFGRYKQEVPAEDYKEALDRAKFERERIIKLLEDMYYNKGEDGNCIYINHYPECCNCELIALIKGKD